jgi:hypothetical protein
VRELLRTKLKRHRKDEAVLIAAMENLYCARSLIELLLADDLKTPKTKGLLIAVLKYPYANLALVKAFSSPLRRGKDSLQMTDSVLIAAASGTNIWVNWSERKKIWDFLLQRVISFERRHETLIVSEQVFSVTIRAENARLVSYLLKPPEKPRKSSAEQLTIAVASRQRSSELVDILLKRRYTVGITAQVLEEALKNPATDGQLVAKLCARAVVTVRVTEKMVLAIASNRERGAELLKVLLLASGKIIIFSSYTVTETVIETAVANGNPPVLEGLASSKILNPQTDFQGKFYHIVAKAPGECFLLDMKNNML